MDKFDFSMDLPLRSEWGSVDLIRSSVENCFTAMYRDVDGCRTLAMIAGELLENAVKYGEWSAAPNSLRLRIWGEDGQARVRVENPVDDAKNRVGELLETIAWIRTFPSAEEAYRTRLLEIASSSERNESKLGLIRIAYEGNCTITADRNADVLRVTAHMCIS
jgi:hypothetical protein